MSRHADRSWLPPADREEKCHGEEVLRDEHAVMSVTQSQMPLLTSSTFHQQPHPQHHHQQQQQQHGNLQSPPNRGFALPPLPHAPTGTRGSFPGFLSTRSTTLPSLPRFHHEDDCDHSPRRRKIPAIETSGSAPPYLPPITQARSSISELPAMLPTSHTVDPGRSSLPTRSPLHRTTSASLIQHGYRETSTQQKPTSPQAQTETQQRIASGASSTGASSVSTSSHHAYPPSYSSAQMPSLALRHASPYVTIAGCGGTSASTSPSASYASFGQADQFSPSSQQRSLSHIRPPDAYFKGSDVLLGPSSASSSQNLREHSHDTRELSEGIPVSTASGNNSTYQMMTLQTASGTVSLPVDVQGASKVADEKRKRNAGASARFRERRKKKEVEASATIRKLEQQNKHLAEEVEYYEQERNYFRDIVMHQMPSTSRLPARPESPRRKIPRASLLAHRAYSHDTSYDAYERAPSPEARNVRRRTLSFADTSPSAGPSPMSGGDSAGMNTYPPSSAAYNTQSRRTSQAPGHPYQASAQESSTTTRPSAMNGQQPPAFGHSTYQAHHLPPPLLQAPPPTGPSNPYASQRYDRPMEPPRDQHR